MVTISMINRAALLQLLPDKPVFFYLLESYLTFSTGNVKPFVNESQVCSNLHFYRLAVSERYSVHICSTGGLLIQARSQTGKSFFFD